MALSEEDLNEKGFFTIEDLFELIKLDFERLPSAELDVAYVYVKVKLPEELRSSSVEDGFSLAVGTWGIQKAIQCTDRVETTFESVMPGFMPNYQMFRVGKVMKMAQQNTLDEESSSAVEDLIKSTLRKS